MTEKLSQQVTLPAWLITLITTSFIAFMLYSTSQIRANQDISTKVEIAAKERQDIQEKINSKADKEELARIYVVLDKMDEKLDRIIQN